MIQPSNNISRKESAALGLTHYFTGRPCKHGHTAKRYTGSGECTDCARIKTRKAAWYSKHPEINRARTKAWAKANPDKIKAQARAAYNRDKDKYKLKARAWIKARPALNRARVYARYCMKRSRLPVWSSVEEVRAIYKACPPGFHVDHIHPLKGASISGLHVANNLQYLSAQTNQEKGNKFTATWPAVDFADDLARAAKGLASFATST